MKSHAKKICILILILFACFLGFNLEIALAQTTPGGGTPTPVSISQGVQSFGQKVYGQSPQKPQVIAVLIINVVLTLLGVIFVALIVYAGYMYMTSQGKEDKVKTAKNIIVTAVIGLIIVLVAYAIADFVITNLSEIFGQGGLGPGVTGT